MTFFDEIVVEVAKIRDILGPILQMSKKDSNGTTHADILGKAGSKSDMSTLILGMSRQLCSTRDLLHRCGSTIEALQTKVIATSDKLLDESEVRELISKKDGAISQLTEENINMKKQLEVDHDYGANKVVENKTAVDWTKIDFSTSISKAVTKSIRVERNKEKKVIDKRNNIMLFGITDPNGDRNYHPGYEHAYVILQELDITRDEVVDIDWIAPRDQCSNYACRITLSHRLFVVRALRRASHLRDCGLHYDNVYVTPDRTSDQLTAHKALVKQLKKAIEDQPGRRWIIKLGKIVDAGDFKQD
jgi:hypothetical protein